MLLALEATDRAGSLALVDDGEILEMSFERSQVTHSERLMPEIDRLLEKRSANYSNLSKIAVARGPGSFTAIRLAVTTAKTLAFSLDLDVLAPTTLRIMAEYGAGRNSLITTALDARRGQVYTQDFEPGETGLEAVSEPRLMTPGELIDHCVSPENPLLIFKGRDLAPDWPEDLNVYPEDRLDPLVSGLVSISNSPGQQPFSEPADDVSPLYVRKSDAQRSRTEGETTA